MIGTKPKEMIKSIRKPYIALKIVLAVIGIIVQMLSYLFIFAVVGHYGAEGVFLGVIFLLPILLIAVDALFIYSLSVGDKLVTSLRSLANILFTIFTISIFIFFLYFLSRL